MNDLNRESLDTEIERIHKKMSEMDPSSEEYGKMVRNVDILMRVANEDDKIHGEATIEELKLDAEIEKAKENSRLQKLGHFVAIGSSALTAITTLTYVIILCTSNRKVQERSILFEMDGYSHTDRSDKFLQKAALPRI